MSPEKAPKVPFTPEGLQIVADSVMAAAEVGQMQLDGFEKRIKALEEKQERP